MASEVFSGWDAWLNQSGQPTTILSTGLGTTPFTATFTAPLTVGQTFTFTDGNSATQSGTYYGTNPNGDLLFNVGGSYQLLTNQSYSQGQQIVVTQQPFVCFLAGTLIRTPSGDVVVESLKIGDLVFTASGDERPIVWLGHRKLDCASLPTPRAAWPVRIAAGAFGVGRPLQDLFVSAGHAICVDVAGEVLIPAHCLVNGATITRVPVETVDYWHVELESHDVLLANGLPAESYLDTSNRDFFIERQGVSQVEGAAGELNYCHPFIDRGPVLQAVRVQLEARAERMGFVRHSDPGLRLLVDGAEFSLQCAEGAAAFLLPKGVREVRLLSSTFVPSDDVGVHDDARQLGVCVHGLTLSDGRRVEQISLEDPRLAEGFFAEEAESNCWWRWTRKECVLPASLFAGFPGAVVLTIAYDAQAQRGWRAPAKEALHEAAPPRKLYAVG